MPDPLQPLFAAIIANDVASAKELLKQNPGLVKLTAAKASLEYGILHWIYAGDTALHAAAAGHRPEMVKLLLASGADPEVMGKHRHARPLHYAADGAPGNPSWSAKRQVATLRLLLAAGANTHAQDKNGATPLHRAVRTRCAAAVQCLLDAGADATIRNKPGSTPFHLAVQNTGRGGSGNDEAKAAQREIIRAFLDHGARPSVKDARGRSVLDWAKTPELRNLLTGKRGD
ncbi:MAG TPA: ankyrin repeat domain-containing protein [Verrucomicrobiae bacterium]|nr:ankyrin repeat domain-containing protein [Verrucomicrobiae bacterium]